MHQAPTAIQDIFRQVHSSSGLSFPETVVQLLALGVTRYHVDFTASTVTVYARQPFTQDFTTESPTSEHVHSLTMPAPADADGRIWSDTRVAEAIRRVQSCETGYAGFVAECAAAGVTGYLAFLTGKKVVYYGRSGDFHVEWFPGAKPDGK